MRADLQDIDLAKLGQKLAPRRPIVLLAKHLCGAATDYVLRAAVSACAAAAAAAADADTDGADADAACVDAAGTDAADLAPVAAILLGTCCHHRCDWAAYPNRGSLAVAGLSTRTDFELLCKLSSRGVDGRRRTDRADAGRRAKDLLDEGRAAYLREAGGFFDASLVRYVDASVTPENVLVRAVWSRRRESAITG